MKGFEYYKGREATWVKHKVLSLYLERLAYKVGSGRDAFSYVDGFAGPWMETTDDLSDTSPYIAIEELQRAMGGLANAKLRVPRVRCLFVEKNTDAYKKLEAFLLEVKDIQTKVLNGEFEENISEAARFVANSFALFFIDPTGWTGFGMNVIAPLLKHEPGEVLINFMTKDVIRFIDDRRPQIRATFVHLFGRDDYQERWHGLSGLEREDAIVAAYCDRVKEVGNFRFVVSTVVLHPQNQRTHFHLIYGTRHPEGLRTFRGIEQKAIEAQGLVRAAAQERERTAKTHQPSLQGINETFNHDYFKELRDRYHAIARQKVKSILESNGRVVYDQLEALTLIEPLTSSNDLDSWLEEWKRQGVIRFEGLRSRERKPKPNEGHFVVWVEERQLQMF